MVKSKRVPISAAKEFGKKYKKDQVIIISYDKETNTFWFTTWGKTKKECKDAAASGESIQAYWGLK